MTEWGAVCKPAKLAVFSHEIDLDKCDNPAYHNNNLPSERLSRRERTDATALRTLRPCRFPSDIVDLHVISP